jgi:hypothetical protein
VSGLRHENQGQLGPAFLVEIVGVEAAVDRLNDFSARKIDLVLVADQQVGGGMTLVSSVEVCPGSVDKTWQNAGEICSQNLEAGRLDFQWVFPVRKEGRHFLNVHLLENIHLHPTDCE